MRKAMRGGKGALAGQVAWLGSPLSLDYPSMAGQVNVAIEAGQFLKAEPGAARLLGVLSLQSLPRRLALDFRDLFSEGFAFDSVDGDVTIGEGVASTNNLRMRGVHAAVLMEGSADIARETQDLRVVVVPEINAGTASLAYAVDQSGDRPRHLPRADVPAQAADRGGHARVPRHRPVGRPEGRARRAQARRATAPTSTPPATAAPPARRSEELRMKIAADADGLDAARRAQPRTARAPDRARPRAPAPSWSCCPSTSASWARSDRDKLAVAEAPATGRSSARCRDAAREHGVWLDRRHAAARSSRRRRARASTRACVYRARRRASRRATTRCTCSASTTAASATTKARVLRAGARAASRSSAGAAGASA